MNIFLIALLPPALWSVTNYIDKYLVSKVFKGGGKGALLIFSSLIGILIIPIIYTFVPEVLTANPKVAILTAINGSIYVLAVLPYLYALDRDDTSLATALFQLGPVFQYTLGYLFLNETLLPRQIAGGLLVVIGALALSFDLSPGSKIKFKTPIFLLMALSSLLFAFNFLFFKMFSLSQSFWTTGFWEFTGFTVFGIILLVFVKPYRTEFLSVMKQNKIPALGLNLLNEIVTLGGKLSYNYVSLLMPLALASILAGVQPLFSLLYGVLLTVFFPKLIKEDITKRNLGHKTISILVMFVGLHILYGQK